MAGNNILLDTAVVIDYFRHNQATLQRLSNVVAYVSSITLGELYFGAYKSNDTANSIRQIRMLDEVSTMLSCDEQTADLYGQIKNRLKLRGRPIPENDIWIAATAIQHGLTLAARDAHFDEVVGLSKESW